MLLKSSLVLLLIFCINTQGYDLPPTPCPNYFQYFCEGGRCFGKITIPSDSKNIDLTVHLSQKTPAQGNGEGQLILESKSPFIYRVLFPVANEVPRITKIVVDGKAFCEQEPYTAPSTNIVLTHKGLTHIDVSAHTYRRRYPHPHPYPRPQFYPHQHFPINPINPIPPARKQDQCGISNNVTPYIFGGFDVMPGQYPWLTAIFLKSGGFLCGGSLVSARTVLSAGHCFKIHNIPANNIVVHFGRNNLYDYGGQGYITRDVQQIVVHPEYHNFYFSDADLALLYLKYPVEFSNIVRPICLWRNNGQSDFNGGEMGIIAGWGADGQGNLVSPVAKQVEAQLRSPEECFYRSDIYRLMGTRRTFCAGNRYHTAPCPGDSGGGMIINRNGRWYLRGIISGLLKSDPECVSQALAIFCDVAQHTEWLKRYII